MDWGFEEDDEVEAVRRSTPDESTDDTDPLSGQDARGAVTITVTDTAAIASVRLAPEWRELAEARELGSLVREAANNATAAAVAYQAQRVDIRAEVAAGTVAPPRASQPPEEEEPPLTREDVRRLLDAVTADLAQFKVQLSTVVDQTVQADSAGEHVTVSGRQGQVLDVSLDVSWLFTARESEIENEVRDALTRLADRSTPGELSRGPQSGAINELMQLVSDPQAMVRRISRRNGRP